MEMRCSIKECGKELLGTSIMLRDQHDGKTFEMGKEQGLYETYLVDTGAPGPSVHEHLVIMHPTCFLELFDELFAQELSAIFTLYVGPINEIREGLEIP